MTEINESKSSRSSTFVRIMEVLLQPRRTLGIIAAESRPTWLTPMRVLSLSTFLSVTVAGYLTARAASLGEMQLPPDWQYWTPDMQNNYMQAQQSMQGPVFVYVIPLVSALVALWLGWLILGGLLHLGSTLLGGRGSMQSALNIAGWASLPFMARDVLRVIFMLIAGHAIVSPGLSGFAGNAEFLGQILARVDIFFAWSCVLLVIGFSEADSLSKNKAVTDVLVVTILLLLAQAGLGALLANMGGTGGVLIGWLAGQGLNVVAVVYLAQQAAEQGGLPPSVAVYTPLRLPVFVLLFSVLIGMVSGLYPALRAATMIPVQALKYE